MNFGQMLRKKIGGFLTEVNDRLVPGAQTATGVVGQAVQNAPLPMPISPIPVTPKQVQNVWNWRKSPNLPSVGEAVSEVPSKIVSGEYNYYNQLAKGNPELLTGFQPVDNVAKKVGAYVDNRLAQPVITGAKDIYDASTDPNIPLFSRNLNNRIAKMGIGGVKLLSATPAGQAGQLVYSAAVDAPKNTVLALRHGERNPLALMEANTQGFTGNQVPGVGDALTDDPTLAAIANTGEMLASIVSPKQAFNGIKGLKNFRGKTPDVEALMRLAPQDLHVEAMKRAISQAEDFRANPGMRKDILDFQVGQNEGSLDRMLTNDPTLGKRVDTIARGLFGEQAGAWSNKKLADALTWYTQVLDGVPTPEMAAPPRLGFAAQNQVVKNGIAPNMPNPVGAIDEAMGAMKPPILNKADDVLESAYKEIGHIADKPKTSLRDKMTKLYTDWVDEYHPIVKAAEHVEEAGKKVGFSLIPKNNPKYAVRRLRGAQAIAQQRFTEEFEPILKQADDLNLPQEDLDVYLKARRDAGFGTVGREIKGSDPAVGQQRMAALEAKYGDGIKNIADQVYQFQNKGFQELVDAGFLSKDKADLIRSQNPDYVPFERIMDEVDDYLGMPSHKAQQSKNVIQKIKGSEREIYSPTESVIANIFKQRAAIEKNNVARSIADLKQVLPDIGFEQVKEAGDDAITVWRDGQKQYWRVGEDIAKSVKGMNSEAMGDVAKLLAYPAGLLRQGATGRNPEFMIPNMIRDQFDAGINSKHGYVPFVDFARGLAHIIKKDDVYDQWIKSGGMQDFGAMNGRKNIHEAINKAQGKQHVWDKLSDWLDVAGKYSEQPTRVGLFGKALKKTGNKDLAMMESRDSTLDFARMGAKMKVFNSIIPFLNAEVQGFDKMARTAKENPGGFALRAGMYAGLPAVTTTLYNTMFHPAEYGEIPQYIKDSNFVIVTGRTDDGKATYITIPKGHIASIANPIENFISYAAGTTPQTVQELATQFLSSSLPLVGDGSSPKEVGIKTIGQFTPQFIKPTAENLINKSFFKYDPTKEQAKSIVPEYMDKLPAGERSYEWTPKAYQAIGRAINVSPLQVQNFLEGHLAGAAKIPANIIDTLYNVSQGEPVDPNKLPLLRRFIGESTTPVGTNTDFPLSDDAVKNQIASQNKAYGPNNERAPLIESASADNSKPGYKYDAKAEAKEQTARFKAKRTGEVQDNGNSYIYVKSNGETAEVPKDPKVDKPTLTGNDTLDKEVVTDYKSSVAKAVNDTMTLRSLGKLTDDQATQRIEALKADVDAVENGDLTVDPLHLTGDSVIDKELKADFKGDVTKAVNKVVEEYKAGRMSLDEASTKIKELRDSAAKTGTGKKKGIKHLTIPAIKRAPRTNVVAKLRSIQRTSKQTVVSPRISRPQINPLKFDKPKLTVLKATK